MTDSLAGRVAVITGGGRGIGRAAALLFAREGASIVIATRTAAPGQAVVDAIIANGGSAALIAVDITSRAAVRLVVDFAIQAFGGIDIILHNAAAMMASRISDLSDKDLDTILTVNLKTAFWFAAEGIESLRASSAGRLLFTSSITGTRQAHPSFAAYGSSKAGLDGFIRQAGFEFGPHGVTVNGVAPGITLTERAQAAMSEAQLRAMAAMIPRGEIGSPEEIAHVLLMLAQPGSSHVTGQTIVVDGGQSLGIAFPG